MKEKRLMIINSGTTSLIMIFAVLAMVTFALLSFSSAGAQWRLAQKMAERTAMYYEAEQQAAETLEQMEIQAEQLVAEGKTLSGQDLERILKELTEPSWNMQRQGDVVSWKIPVGEKQQLEIRLRLSMQGMPGGWQLEGWQMTEKENGGTQQTMQLYAGN